MCIRDSDAQMVLPTLILQHAPVFAQAIFYGAVLSAIMSTCLLYTSDAADERSSVDLGGRRIIKKKKNQQQEVSLIHLCLSKRRLDAREH